MMEFAKANANLFPKEAKVAAGLRVGSVVTFSTSRDLELGIFDSTAEELVIQVPGSIDFETVLDQCRSGRSFVGENAFGAKATVTTRRCDRLVAEATEDAALELGERKCESCSKFERVVRIPMKPAQYREAKARGLRLEIDFEVGTNVKDELVIFQEFSEPATLHRPQMTTVRLYKLQGTVLAVRWYRPSEKQPALEQRR